MRLYCGVHAFDQAYMRRDCRYTSNYYNIVRTVSLLESLQGQEAWEVGAMSVVGHKKGALVKQIVDTDSMPMMCLA